MHALRLKVWQQNWFSIHQRDSLRGSQQDDGTAVQAANRNTPEASEFGRLFFKIEIAIFQEEVMDGVGICT